MKNKIQIMFVRGLQKALNHDNGPRLPRHWKVIASTILLLLTLGIGQMWGADAEIIKVVLSGSNGATKTMSGTIGGTCSVDKLSSSSPYKLNSTGAYVSLTLSTGYFEQTDVVTITGADGAHQIYYGTPTSGTLLCTTGAPSSGTITCKLWGLPANQNTIYLYRASDTYNKKVATMAVTRPDLSLTGSGTVTYTMVSNSDAVTGDVTNVKTVAITSSQFAKSTLNVASGNSKAGYSGQITGHQASFSESSYLALGFSVTSGYTFAPTAASCTIFANDATTMKAKVVISDGTTTIESEELSCSKSADSNISFASSAFTDKKLSGNVTVKVYMWGQTSKRAYIKSPLTITGTVASAVAPECSTPANPTGLAVGTITGSGATFTITDAANTNNYEIVCKESSTTPASDATPTETGTSQTIAVTGLDGGTTYYAWVRAVCDATHKSSWVALGSTFTTLQAITPSLSYTNNPLVLTVRTSGAPTLTGNTGSGTVTWNSSAEGVATVDASGNITAVAAGTTTITASIAANGGYAAGEATATVKVAAAPLGIVDQKLATGNVAWDASVIVTSDYTNITNITALSQHGSATASGNGNTSNGGQTSKVGTATGDFNDANYLELSFDVASGKKLDITAVHIPVQPVSSDVNNFKAVLSDDQGSTEIVGTKTNLGNGTLADIDFSSYGSLKGTVTLRIYAWGWSNGYRLGKNIYITGTISSAVTPTGYAISTSTENGTIAVTDGSSTITSAEKDDVVYIAATPATGYGFTSWDIYKTSDATTKVSLLTDDDLDNKTRKFSMPAYPVTVGATFSAIDYTVTHNAASNGSYTIKVDDEDATDENTTANYGQTVTLAATPASGYVFSSWTVLQGETPVSVTNNQFTMPAGNVTVSASFDEITCPTEGTVYSASTSATGNISIAASAENLELNSSTHKTTVSGGKMYVYNGQTSAVNLITATGFSITNGNTYFHIQLDCPLEAGDIISVKVGKNSSERGVWISSTRTDEKPGSAPACALTATGTGSELKAVTYTVTGSDEYHGKTDFYIYRATNNGTYFNDISITRPEKFDVTYWKNDGSETKTEAEGSVVADNEFTRSGYRFIEWNTQADGNGSKVNVGAAVTVDIELFAIWAQEYSVSYANTGAASGDAPTNENKYIAGEKFKVAGVGSMVAAENYAFGGWDDGTAIYQENDDYTVGSANVSFTPVWNLHYTVTYKANGGTGDDIVVDNPAKIADCVFETPENKLFDKWNSKAEGDGANYAVGADVSSTLVLYAIWKDDECTTNRKSIFKAVLTGDAAATVTGENGKEYAGDALLYKLGGSDSNRNTDATIEGVGSGLTTYKMNGTGAYMYGTLKKGAFQEGDKIHFAVSSTPGTLAIYGAKSSDLSQRVHIADMPAPNAAKVFTYTLTAANATALAGYDAIGIYRADGVTMNPFLYSLEITGCRVWTITHDVTFDMKSHGTQVEKQTLEVGAKVTEPAEPEAAGYIFGGWYKETTLENKWNFSTDVVPDNDIILYAKWTEDPCTDRQSLSKVVLTSASAGTVTGYNSDEYAGTELIAGLSGSKSADLGDGSVTGYKLNNGGSSMLMATLKKGNFQEGDKVTIGIVYQNDQRTVDDSKNIMTIYAGSDASHMMEVTTLTGVTGAGYYTYRLTAADAAAINEAGYKSIGLFRASSNGQNHYVYSVEITGCREWAITHTVTFNKMGKGADIAPAVVAEGDKVTKPTVVEPEGWALAGWYKEEGLVNEWNFDVDVMGEENITLYAKWEDESGAIKLFDGEGNLNTTKFVSPAKTTIEINEVEYTCLAQFSANRTSLGGATPSDMVQYNATTDAAKIKMTFYNNNSGVKKAILYKYEEGAESPEKIEIEVPGQTIYTTDYYTFNSSKNRSFYVCMNDRSNIRVLQVKVMDNGTAIQQAGQAGYSLNLNKGRMYVSTSAATSFEGATINVSSEYKVYNNGNMATNSYISFTTTVDKMILKVTRSGGNYYVSQDPENKGTSYNTNKEIELSPAGTWYLGSSNPGSAASFTKIEFIAPKCEAPEFNALANSDICSGDAYVALDGTGTVSDGGSITYKWYAHGADESDPAAVLGTDATYTPEADGNYYVKALHHVDGYTDNEATSDEVTVKTHAGTAISEPLADQRGNVDAVVALEVVASGKNLHYAWKESATIDGEYTAVAGAADAASLNVTITEGMDKYYKVIVSGDCGDAQESVAHVTQYVPVAQANVTGSIAWDWTKAASVNEIKLTSQTSPKKNEGFVMANGAATIYNNANFESDKLYLEGEYITRYEGGNHLFQGQTIKFNTTVAGLVHIKFSNTGSNAARELYINGVGTGNTSASATMIYSDYVEVPAGEVSITAYLADKSEDASQKYIRVSEIEFRALEERRAESWIVPGELGTVCLKNDAKVVGANLYELQGHDENGYMAFDQIMDGEMEAGKPYLFEATAVGQISFYTAVGANHTDEAGSQKGMYGTFENKVFNSSNPEDLDVYYFSGRHIWAVKNYTVDIPVNAYRCYVKMDEFKTYPADASPAPGRRRVTLGVNGNNAPTDVENVQSDEVQCTKVMINGQLFILRGEKMFDATGRLVK